MAKYEILYIIRPNIEEEAKNALVARFDSILTDNGDRKSTRLNSSHRL